MCELPNIAASDDFKNILVAGDWSNIVSRDGGATWEESSKGADISCIEDLCFCRDSVYAVAMDQGLFRSDDSGTTWKQLFPLKLDFEVCGDQYRVYAEEKNGATKILSTFTPWINRPNGVFISEDGGKSFELIKAGLPDYVTTLNCMYQRGRPRGLAVDPVDTNVIYLGMEGDPEPGKSGGGIFKSTDGGKTWHQLAAQPGSRRILQGLVIDPCQPQSNLLGSLRTDRRRLQKRGWRRVLDQDRARRTSIQSCGHPGWLPLRRRARSLEELGPGRDLEELPLSHPRAFF